MKKLRSRKGFTLVEMLIVIAIIAILSAIALPAFTAMLERARRTVDQANARSASTLAYSEYMLCHSGADGSFAGKITYTFGCDEEGNLLILSHSGEDKEPLEDGSNGEGTPIKGSSSTVGDSELSVSVEDGKIVENSWLALLNAA